ADQPVDVGPARGREGDQRRQPGLRVPALEPRQEQLLVLHGVDLVDPQDHGPSGLGQAAQDLRLGLARAIGPSVDDQQRGVDVGDDPQRLADHEAVELFLGAVNARRVDEDDLPAGAVVDAGDAVPRRLRLGRDDGQLLADDPVEQRRLADVGSAQDRNGARHAARARVRGAGLVAGGGLRRLHGGFYITQMSCYPRGMRIFSALALLGLWATLPSPPAAAATGLRLTTAADGALEVRNGDDLLTRVALKTPALRRGTPTLRDVTSAGHRLAELRVPVRGTSAEEVWIGEVAGRARRVVWSGVTGPRDADGETSLWVEVTPERVVEYQTAAGVDRCDGLPPRLFPRGYDFDAGRFRPIVSTLPLPGGEKLVAHRGDPGMPTGRPIGDFHFVGASTTRGAGSDARGLTPPV